MSVDLSRLYDWGNERLHAAMTNVTKGEGPLNKLTIAGLSLLATVGVTMPADAAGTTAGSNDLVYVIVRGQKTGTFTGDTTKQGQIAVYHITYNETAPRDSASGLPSGKRVSNPITFTKALDKSSPQFFGALVNNENLTTVTFNFYGSRAVDGRVTSTGNDGLLYTITLTNASIASDEIIGPSDKDPASGVAYPGAVEQVSLVYQKITVTAVGGVTSADNWNRPI
jgi:type VI secretion system secreted protein Hcp